MVEFPTPGTGRPNRFGKLSRPAIVVMELTR